jgi:hypothetical protein
MIANLRELSLVKAENLRATKTVNKPELIHDSGFVRIYEVKNTSSRDYYVVDGDSARHIVSFSDSWLAKDERYTQICAELNLHAVKSLPGKSSNMRFRVLAIISNAYNSK